MIIQKRSDGLRLFRQHDHALLCGQWAHAWSPSLPMETVMAIALHDMSWVDADEALLRGDAEFFGDDTPCDFIGVSDAFRSALYSAGLDTVERLHPWVAALTSAHYASFIPESLDPQFAWREDGRRAKLAERYSPALATRFASDFALLQFLDLLCIYACIAAPGSDPASHPKWLRPRATPPTHPAYTWRWLDDHTLGLDPFTLTAPVSSELPYIDVVGTQFEGATAFAEACAAGTHGIWRLTLSAG